MMRMGPSSALIKMWFLICSNTLPLNIPRVCNATMLMTAISEHFASASMRLLLKVASCTANAIQCAL